MIPAVISFRQGALAALLAAVYFVAAKLSLPLAIPPGYATAVWPPCLCSAPASGRVSGWGPR